MVVASSRPVEGKGRSELLQVFVDLFIIFPERAHKGMMGLELGTLTPLFVFLFNAVWGITAMLWLLAAKES